MALDYGFGTMMSQPVDLFVSCPESQRWDKESEPKNVLPLGLLKRFQDPDLLTRPNHDLQVQEDRSRLTSLITLALFPALAPDTPRVSPLDILPDKQVLRTDRGIKMTKTKPSTCHPKICLR